MIKSDTVTFFLDQRLMADVPKNARHLSDLRGIFADVAAYEAAIIRDNPLIYQVASVEPAEGDGQLHYGLGMLLPGRIGEEYYMTRGHFHAYRPAAEVYITLRGEGAMLLEDESGASRLASMHPNNIVYVPGHTAHRTINTGSEPLMYLGVYPANAGHDYASIAVTNFRSVVIAVNGQPTLIPRADYPAQANGTGS